MFNRIKYCLFVTIAVAGAVTVLRADEEKPWDRSVALGLSVTGGNTDSVLFNGSIAGNKVWTNDELRLGLDAAYGKTEGVENNEKVHGAAQYKHLFTERWYFTLVGDGLHDGIAHLAYRFSISPGIGYYFIKSDKTRLSGEVGPAYVIERFQGQGIRGYPALRLGERFDRQLNETAKLWQAFDILPDLGNFNKYVAVFEVGVEAALTKNMSLRLVGQDRYDSQPASGRKRNDTSLVSALAFKF